VTEGTFAVQVRWSDPDMLGHVNHARYLTYFEDARMALVSASPSGLSSDPAGRGAIAARVAVDYRRQVRFTAGLILTVRTTVSRIGTSSWTLRQLLFAPDDPGSPVAEGECVLVAFDYLAGRPRPLDDDERAYWGALQPAVAP
jgi:acyl-CoA thioester hydrolase